MGGSNGGIHIHFADILPVQFIILYGFAVHGMGKDTTQRALIDALKRVIQEG